MTRVEQMRKRLEAATPGPWTHDGQGGVWSDQPDSHGQTLLVSDATDENGDFIAHAHNDLRVLLDLYDALVKSRSIVSKKPTINEAVESALSRLEQEVPP